MTIEYFVAVAIIIILYYWNRVIGSVVIPNIQRIPGSVPFLGHSLLMTKYANRIHEFLHEFDVWANFKVWQLNLPFFPAMINFNNPKILEHVTKTNFGNYIKGPLVQKSFDDALGIGIIVVDGEHWRFQRKIAGNIFTISNFKTFVEQIFRDEMVIFEQLLESLANSGAHVDLHDLFHRYTMETFTYMAFGIKLNCLSDKEIPFAHAFDFMQKVIVKRFLDPTHRLKEYFLQIGKDYRQSVRLVRDFGAHVIESRRKDDTNPRNEMDLIGLFMNEKDEKGNPCFSDKELIDIALTFMMAGRDTIAQALSWTFYCLAKNSRAHEKAVKEIMEIMRDSDMPTYEQVKNLVYVKACYLEALRLYPSAPSNFRVAVKDDIWPDGTFVPKDSIVSWSNYSIGRNPAIWGSDAEEYRPERWLEMETQPSQFQYSVFNCGPRLCLGKNMAELEGTFVLACFLRRFKFVPLDLSTVYFGSSLTLAMEEGFKGMIFKR